MCVCDAGLSCDVGVVCILRLLGADNSDNDSSNDDDNETSTGVLEKRNCEQLAPQQCKPNLWPVSTMIPKPQTMILPQLGCRSSRSLGRNMTGTLLVYSSSILFRLRNSDF